MESTTAIDRVLMACRERPGVLAISGRDLDDFVMDDDKIRPFRETMRRELYRKLGMVFVTYSLANGISWYEGWISNNEDKATIRKALEECGLLGIKRDEREVVATIRAAAALLRDRKDLKWRDGRDLRFALVFEFADHLAPCVAPGAHTDQQLVAIELVYIVCHSLALRDSGNIIILHGKHDFLDERIRGAAKHLHLPQPAKEEKADFLRAALELYDKTTFEAGLTAEGAVTLSVNTPNRSIERLLRSSHRTGRAVTAREIAAQKDLDVEQLTEGTLTPLDTSRVRGLQLVGRNIETARSLLERLGDWLLLGDTSMPANILLCGAPSTGKTDLAILAAARGKCPAYQLHSPKGGVVGETERKSRRQQEALKEWVPNVAFCDEVTDVLPLERGDFNGDSGASLAVSAALLTALSDETRRGRSLFIGTTNRVWAMGAAMRSRFKILPVLSPLREDYPAIIASTVDRIVSGSSVDIGDQEVQKAADIFYSKGANARQIREAISNALLLQDTKVITASTLLWAANDVCPMSDWRSSVFADLQAIKYCTSRSFLPWIADTSREYNFPEYLKGIVDTASGEVDSDALERKLEELRPAVNV